MAQPSSAPGNSRKGEPLAKRSYTLNLTFSSLVTAGIVLIIGIGWAFVLGVMVGRGYNPEKKVPQLSRWLPQEEQAADRTKPQNVGETLPKMEVMPAEDLKYSTSLKGRKNATETRFKPVQQNAAAPVAGAVTQTGQPSQTPPPPVPQERTAPPAPAVPPAPTQPVYDYVFQVATFKDLDSVNSLRVRLEGEGYRSRMDKDGRLLKVMVLLRGDSERADTLQARMKSMGLGQPIQRSKTPVKGKRN